MLPCPQQYVDETTLEMHGIENRWDPLGQLFSDDNSERDSLMRTDWKLWSAVASVAAAAAER